MIILEKIGGGLLWSRDDNIVFERVFVVYIDEIDNCWEKIVDFVLEKILV